MKTMMLPPATVNKQKLSLSLLGFGLLYGICHSCPLWVMRGKAILFGFFLGLLSVQCAGKAVAFPDFSSRRIIHGVVVYQDAQQPHQYYYLPGDLKVIHDTRGKPDFHFVQMRYTGSKARGDQGSYRFKSLLQLRIGIERLNSKMYEAVEQELSQQEGLMATLSPLPLQRIEAVLVFASISPQNTTQTHMVTGGFMDTPEDAEEDHVLWKERIFTIRLDNYTSQVFWDTFQKGQSQLSVAFSYYAYGLYKDSTNVQVAVNDEVKIALDPLSQNDSLQQAMQDHFQEVLADLDKQAGVQTRIVMADAFQLIVDAQQYPELMEKVDINEHAPSSYSLLDVYCYDFNNQIRNDLHARKVEIKATGVNGKPVITSVIFREKEPDLYVRSIRFAHAVRMDLPHHYRIIEISKEKGIQPGAWVVRTSWESIIDITTRANSNRNF